MRLIGTSRDRFAYLSQNITSLTNFITSVSAIAFLEPADFRKWFIYVSSTLALQGVMRTSVLESDLIDFGRLQKKHYLTILRVSALPIFLVPAINAFLNTSVTTIDIILSLYGFFILVQDACRYAYLSHKPKYAMLSDSVWLLTALILMILIISTSFVDLSVFLSLVILGPITSLVILFVPSRSITSEQQWQVKIQGKIRERNFLVAQAIYGTMVTVVINFFVAKFCSANELHTIRLIQTISSPFQALASAYWLTVILRKSESGFVRDIIRKNLTRIVKFIFLLVAIICSFEIFSRNYIRHSYADDWKTILIAVATPIFNAVLYSSTYILRYFKKYKGMMLLSIFVSTILLITIIFYAKHLTAFSFFIIQFTAIFILQFLYLLLCLEIRNNKYEINNETPRFVG
jgi:hypothetical protein